MSYIYITTQVLFSLVCDAVFDCKEGSDELDCGFTQS